MISTILWNSNPLIITSDVCQTRVIRQVARFVRNLRRYLGYTRFAVSIHVEGNLHRGQIWRNVGWTGGGRGLKRWNCGGGESEGLESWVVCGGERTKAWGGARGALARMRLGLAPVDLIDPNRFANYTLRRFLTCPPGHRSQPFPFPPCQFRIFVVYLPSSLLRGKFNPWDRSLIRALILFARLAR